MQHSLMAIKKQKYLIAVIFFVLTAIGATSFYYLSSSKPFEIVILSEKPDVKLYKNFISKEEAAHLINISKDNLQHSSVLKDGEHVLDTYWRTSSNAYIPKSNDEIVKRIEERVSHVLNCPISHIEPLQVAHYSRGQKFEPHFDYFTEKELPYQASQRVHTFILYLNDLKDEDGGKTTFPKLNIEVKPTLGTGLYFRNMDENNNVDPLTLHAGSPVETDAEKWICTIWVLEKPFQFQ